MKCERGLQLTFLLTWTTNMAEQKFSLQYQYNIKAISNENREQYQLGDY